LYVNHQLGIDLLAETNVLDVHIGKLRRKIDAADENRLIHCVRGTGFMLVDLS